MKTLLKSTWFFLILGYVFLLSSCEQNGTDPGTKGIAEFAIDIQDDKDQSKSGDSDSTALLSYHMLISIEDMDGNPVLSDELIPVYIFGSGFVSENVELSTGEYRLSKFMVIDPSGNVKYASPLEGSALAYLVNDPLPISFRILADQTTNVRPEVLPVGNYPPEEFGYVNFGIQVIKPLHFYTVCILDNPLIMAPTRFTEADLIVYGPDNWHYKFEMKARINHLVIRGGAETYYFVLKKEGYPAQRMRFTARQLMATSPTNPLILRIPWYSNLHKLVLQPGPEEGKDAMISNLEPDKNFGDHKYFEATFLSESPITIMRSNRSLISFNKNAIPKSATVKYVGLRLFYDLPIAWDTIVYSTGPTPSNTGETWYGAVLQKVIEPWEENKVTWDNQPKSIADNQVYLTPFIRNVNFIDLDVTGLFFDNNDTTASQEFDMLFKLYPTEMFSGFRFVSSDFEIEYMRPILTIYYSLPD